MEPCSVICVDDDEMSCRVYTLLLQSRGYTVNTYSDSVQFSQEFPQHPVQLYILDIDMPGKTGLQLCGELRKHPITFNTPIIIVSADESEEVIVSAITAGADDYIIKPVKTPELLAKITTALRKRQSTAHRELGLSPGDLFAGRYQILERVGSGGFSRVFRALDTSKEPHLIVALKVFDTRSHAEKFADYLPMFLREAYGLSKLNHPHIIRFYNFGQVMSQNYLAMEFAEGKSLQMLIDDSGPLSEINTATIGYQILQALRYLASHRIVHRDITPNNVMIVQSGDVKLIDFGLAKIVNDGTLTPEGLFAGSPQYAAPELIMNKDLDTRADIFSLGATLYSTATNLSPFSGQNPMEIFQSRFVAEPNPLLEINPNFSVKFADLIENMMKLEPEERPHFDEIETQLLEIMDK